ncbi:GntR family transcriptional regulator [Clostridia bacterium OttesenSCG-928-O13]|nr:GntR family transcriptional regulator [Clostridia bacterium OttesenSCG-928-O13]
MGEREASMELTPVKRKSLSDLTKEYLLAYIRSVGAQENPKIPPEVEIAEHLSVSRVTVRRALNDLENSGLILRIHGKGTFVNTNAMRINLNLNPGQDFARLISESGYAATSKLLPHGQPACDEEMANKLLMPAETLFVKIRRLFLAGDIPSIYCDDYVPAQYLGSRLDTEALAPSTFAIIRENAGLMCIRDSVTIRTCGQGEMEDIIGQSDVMKCSSALILESVNYDQNNQPVFFCRVLYDTNIIRFNMMRSLEV